MSRVSWQDRILIDSDIHHGEPCVKGTRISVAVLLGSLADGMTADQILESYPQLTIEDIRAVLAYAADVVRKEIILPLSA